MKLNGMMLLYLAITIIINLILVKVIDKISKDIIEIAFLVTIDTWILTRMIELNEKRNKKN